ncbi:MAG: M28 family peptidase [bacterium]|nr:hypothetical protein [Deltaproteobacteria bacterium]MCP4905316.1 M28 family peptidase [bacterium]
MSSRSTPSTPRRCLGQFVLLLSIASFGCAPIGPGPERARAPGESGSFEDVTPLLLPKATHATISADDLEAHIRTLSDPRTGGRRAGTAGERVAVDYLVRVFDSIGLEPDGNEGDSRSRFSFTSGVDLGPDNTLTLFRPNEEASHLEAGVDWRPLAFSRSDLIPSSQVVFAGYGLVVPEDEGRGAIDDYSDVEVRDRWVLVFRDLPNTLGPDERQALQRHASLRYKAMVARDHGARGILFASGPLGRFRKELVPLRFDASLAGTRIAVVSIRDAVAERLLIRTGGSLESIQAGIDAALSTDATAEDDFVRPGLLSGIELGGRIDLVTRKAEGTNVIGRIRVGDTPSPQTIVLGAHFDHLGHGEGSGSLASGDDVGDIHPGADDNASGTALLIEIAESLASRKRAGENIGDRDFVFAAWSGEELGLLGSHAWVEAHVNPHTHETGPVAYLNFDMVGRLREKLIIQGLGSSSAWAAIIENAAQSLDLSISLQQDSYLPTDATSFYTQGVPVLAAFTGVHSEYHTPRDTPDLLNHKGMAKIGELFEAIAEALSRAPDAPAYHAQESPSAGLARSGFRVFLGTVPDYAQTELVGVRLSGVAPTGPAEEAGVRGGDIIIEVDGRPIENLYDYTYALEALRVGVSARVTILRAGERVEFDVVPASRN